MSRNKVKSIVKKYARELERRDFPFSQIFLYGSYATGKAKAGSDIDVCVVSPVFSGKKWNEYEKQLWQWRRGVDARIEPIGLAPADLKSWSPLAYQIKKYGVRVV